VPGSSPRAWGKGRFLVRGNDQARIIPTCVGKRYRRQRRRCSATDHPHVRGEKTTMSLMASTLCGSSPRAWGKVAMSPGCLTQSRIIPTCVGKRRFIASRARFQSDHPHVRGEKGPASCFRAPAGGSSPRAWGKGVLGQGVRCLARIIPTCVGKSRASIRSGASRADHPHVRGEKTRRSNHTQHNGGSSPRAWGKGRPSLKRFADIRIIPTCVGKSPKCAP